MDFNWSSMKSNVFAIDEIENREGPDKLFASLLIKIDKMKIDTRKEFTIDEISKLVPIGTAGMNKNTIYGSALICMLSGKQDRDYFIFNRKNLRNELTASCINSANYYSLIRCINEAATINPKYIL